MLTEGEDRERRTLLKLLAIDTGIFSPFTVCAFLIKLVDMNHALTFLDTGFWQAAKKLCSLFSLIAPGSTLFRLRRFKKSSLKPVSLTISRAVKSLSSSKRCVSSIQSANA
mgnify:CR=1 FL=1